jgi:hypothetical protein
MNLFSLKTAQLRYSVTENSLRQALLLKRREQVFGVDLGT